MLWDLPVLTIQHNESIWSKTKCVVNFLLKKIQVWSLLSVLRIFHALPLSLSRQDHIKLNHIIIGVDWCQYWLNTLRPRQNGHHFTDDISEGIFFNESVWILNEISLKYIPWGLIYNMAALVQIMAWHWTGDKPLSEAMLVCCTDAYRHHWASTRWVDGTPTTEVTPVTIW